KISVGEYQALPDIEKKYFRPVTDNDSIYNGQLKTINYVWYPYDSNGLILKTETEFRECAPTVYEKFVPFKTVLANRARKDDNSWWYLSEHRAWQREAAIKLISTEFGSSASFTIDTKGD